MRRKSIGIVLCVAALAICYPVAGQIEDTTKIDEPKVIERKIKTIYDMNGRPVNQGQDRKGWHQVVGLTKLSSGKSTMALNTSTAQGRQDISFLSSFTYRGVSWSLDTTNTRRYWVVPLTGTTFMVKSSDGSDTSTVHWKVEGE